MFDDVDLGEGWERLWSGSVTYYRYCRGKGEGLRLYGEGCGLSPTVIVETGVRYYAANLTELRARAILMTPAGEAYARYAGGEGGEG